MSDLTMACISDLAGIVRGKGFATSDLDRKIDRGIGWTPTNALITCFDNIAVSPYGALGDLVLRLDANAQARAALPDGQTLAFVLGDVHELSGEPWECCTRNALKKALSRFQVATGLELRVTFEHEFMLPNLSDAGSFTLAGFQDGLPFAEALLTALEGAGIFPDSFLREYGPGQFEVTLPPATALRAADEAVMLREITRAVARSMRVNATFTPLFRKDVVGNGVHVHFSLWSPDGTPATIDAAEALTSPASAFIAGILGHLNAVCAFSTPSAISGKRLQPHRWSAWINNLGDKDREAAIRMCPVSATDPAGRARQAHFELRVVDAAASPHLALAAIINAGTLGIEAELCAPAPTTEDLSLLTASDLAARNLTPLPGTLPDALVALAEDRALQATLPGRLCDIYTAHKKGELDYLKGKTEAEVFALYAKTY